MSVTQLVLRYSAFAVVATFLNLAAQRLWLAVYVGAYAVPVAIFFGTVVGLVVKFYLDKRWIFHDVSTSTSANSRKFGLYTLMGVATTVIFWGMEYSFWVVWGTDLMREVGAVVGLAIGYVTKYNLDRHFVFTDGPRAKGAT